MTPKDALIDLLTKKKSNATDLYGIFFDNTLINITKARIYMQPGRAKSELIGQNFWTLTKDVQVSAGANYTESLKERKKAAVQAVDELIKEGRLEIKKI